MIRNAILLTMIIASSTLLASDISEESLSSNDDKIFSFSRRVHFNQEPATSLTVAAFDINHYWDDTEQAWRYPPESEPHKRARKTIHQAALDEHHPKRINATTLLWYSDEVEDKNVARQVFAILMANASIDDSERRMIIMRFKESKNAEDNQQGRAWNKQFFPNRAIKASSSNKKCVIM